VGSVKTVGKNILPFVILGIAGLGVVWVSYKMFKSKEDDHYGPTHVPIHAPAFMPVHTGHRIVSSTQSKL
jgi:hypothetical protein